MNDSEIRKYINLVNKSDITEAVNLHKKDHGIDDVVIWVGKGNGRHGPRVKVSNAKNSWRNDDNFTIKIPSLDYNYRQAASWITHDILEKIFQWIKLNQQVLYDFENGTIMYSDELINKLSRI